MFATFRTMAITAVALALTVGFAAPAQAGYIVTLTEGPDPSNPLVDDVFANGSGPLDLTDLTPPSSNGGTVALINPMGAFGGTIRTGPTSFTGDMAYSGATGPGSFGSGTTTTLASSGSGDLVAVTGFVGAGASFIDVPVNYVSGNPLSDNSTYDSATFASLGVTPGTYKWTWGTGAHADSLTLDIVAPAAGVPEPASLALLAVALAGLGMVVRLRRG